MITASTNNIRKTFYNMAEFLCDYQSDVADLPTDCGVGSKATVIENSNVYILNGAKLWILQSSGNTSGGNSSGGNTPNTGDTIIYEGGDLEDSSSDDNNSNVVYEGTDLDLG
jgi:hypothetical protein